MWLFGKGMIIGFCIAVPVGPIGILCLRRTVAKGVWSGFTSGLGAATGDALCGLIAGLGITFLISYFLAEQFWLRLAGGLFLSYLAVATFKAGVTEAPPDSSRQGRVSDYFSTFLLTITNPLTVIFFLGVFAACGLGELVAGYVPAIVLGAGIFSGSLLLWLVLSWLIGIFRARLNRRSITWINKLAGTIIAVFAVVTLISTVYYKLTGTGM